MMLVSSLAMAAVLAEQPQRVVPAPPAVVIAPSPEAQRLPAPLPTPSTAARELALRMLERIAIIDQLGEQAIRGQVRPWSGDGCDYGNAECRAVVDEIVARETPAAARTMRDVFARILGAHFDRTMTGEQIAGASALLETEAGRALITSLTSINAQTVAGIDSPDRYFSPRRDELRAEFVRRTRQLPRAIVPVPPSPSPYPPPPAPPR